MITIENYNEIPNNLPKLDERFVIKKGKRTATYKVTENKDFGCLQVVRCENLGLSMGGTYINRETPIGGGGMSIEKCVKSAYDHT
jgi:hypothetical protein